MAEEFIPIFMFAAITVILWKFFETRHKERMAIIDKSLDPLAYKELFNSQMRRDAHGANDAYHALLCASDP